MTRGAPLGARHRGLCELRNRFGSRQFEYPALHQRALVIELESGGEKRLKDWGVGAQQGKLVGRLVAAKGNIEAAQEFLRIFGTATFSLKRRWPAVWRGSWGRRQ